MNVGGDALRVVVGRFEHSGVLPAIDAKDEETIVGDGAADSAQEGRGLGRREVADRRAGEERDAACAFRKVGKMKRCRVVGVDRMHGEVRVLDGDLGGHLRELLARDVDRHVRRDGCARGREGVEQQPNFHTRAAAVLHQRAPRATQRGDLCGPCLEDLEFRTRQIVLG